MSTTARRTSLAALATAALLLSGCGSQEAPDDPTTGVGAPGQTTSAEPADPGTTTDPGTETTGTDTGTDTDTETATDAPGGDGPVELGVDNVGDLQLPAAADEAVEALVPLLGQPTSDLETDGCEPSSTMRVVWWDDFGLSGQGEAGSLELTSWEVVGSDHPPNLVLPEGLDIGDSEEAVRTALPDAEWTGPEGTPHGGKLALDGDLMVKLDAQDDTVSSASAHISEVSCE